MDRPADAQERYGNTGDSDNRAGFGHQSEIIAPSLMTHEGE
jgi:hypothetical protein